MSKVYVGRQPIYDKTMKVFAYEILYRSGQTFTAGVIDGNQATSQVLLNTFFEIGFERLTDNKPAFFNLTREFLMRDLELPKESVVLEVLEDIDIDDEVVAAVQRLSDAGFRIALDDFVFEPKWEPLLKLADFIKVEIPAMDPAKAREQVGRLKRLKAKILAEKVETHEEFEACKKLGFDLFQGYFFCKPKVIEGKSVSGSKLGVLRLLAKVQEPDPDVGDLEKLIRGDSTLSYKLLRYLNSPGLGLRNRVTSIRQAVTYLGMKTLRTWVTLLAMSSMPNKPNELAKLSLQRGRLCELAAKGLKQHDLEPFFIAGLLSTLDALMDMPMEEIVKELPLADEVVAGLVKREGMVGKLLEAALNVERGDWELTPELEAIQFNTLTLESMFWADEQMKAIGA